MCCVLHVKGLRFENGKICLYFLESLEKGWIEPFPSKIIATKIRTIRQDKFKYIAHAIHKKEGRGFMFQL